MNKMTGEQRKQLIDDIMAQHASGSESLGTAIRRLRLEVTGFDQQTFAAMCSMSTRALYLIETDKGNPTLGTVDSILRKFGLRLGLMSTSIAQNTKPTVPAQTVQGDQAVGTSRAGQNPLGTVVTRGSKPRSATEKNVLPAKPARSGSKTE
jgi:DNA-binding phage protein